MLMCTVLSFAMCADPNVSAAMVFGDLTVPVVWSRIAIRSCGNIGQDSTTDGAGLTVLETAWKSQESKADGSGYAGRLIVRIDDARIDMTAFSWERMTPAEAEVLREAYRATLWHEIGHVLTGLASVAAVNVQTSFAAPTAAEYTALAKQRGSAAVARISADQDAYDAAAAHGLRQESLPPPLRGPNTVVNCPGR